eukprot:CAMPEP_0118694412 /NCGR_PEP_ID=MMETSP0800-20121206/12508_1 /TAXON_ID=210618 ORGANISM="Striatella unipunctata, Strain CCMP2910" /NCGR_SAMPLE_ID=MMETSP0800 /ASSEMBLY_ACC=CAM_ASM_000638 /LENGTH=313 /DNA_ID=CAMNT_0006592873 /DNA_START=68 /DNA_END=1009 /DNA_ORIENTATION=+
MTTTRSSITSFIYPSKATGSPSAASKRTSTTSVGTVEDDSLPPPPPPITDSSPNSMRRQSARSSISSFASMMMMSSNKRASTASAASNRRASLCEERAFLIQNDKDAIHLKELILKAKQQRRMNRQVHVARTMELHQKHSLLMADIMRLQHQIASCQPETKNLSLHAYADALRTNKLAVSSNYVILIQAQLCQKWHLMELLEMQYARTKEHWEKEMKDALEDLKLLDEELAVKQDSISEFADELEGGMNNFELANGKLLKLLEQQELRLVMAEDSEEGSLSDEGEGENTTHHDWLQQEQQDVVHITIPEALLA